MKKDLITSNSSYKYSIVNMRRDCIGASMVQCDIKRLTTYTKDSISSQCSSNLPCSNRLFVITNRNILITFSFRRKAICRRANILPLVGKLSKGAASFREGHQYL